eukprot:SAG31_NODE_7479_length_1679_cov_1.360127_1_plen_152_part_00
MRRAQSVDRVTVCTLKRQRILTSAGGEQFFCPIEAVAHKTGRFDERFDWARAKYTSGQRVTLVSDPEQFREAFFRFDGDEDGNDWSAEKDEKIGQSAVVTVVFDDKTLTLEFDDGMHLDFPYEAIEPTDATALALIAFPSQTPSVCCQPCN